MKIQMKTIIILLLHLLSYGKNITGNRTKHLTEDALYYWKVVATDDDGGETSSSTWSFWPNNINSAPAEFTLVSPEQDEETGLTPTFSWNESSDADLYDVNDSNFKLKYLFHVTL